MLPPIKTKVCPRCKEKCAKDNTVCDFCGLKFSKLEIATNSAGKKMIKSGKKDKVIYVKQLPKDVKKWKLFLMSLFTGLFGGHCFYVGKYVKGIVMLIFGIVLAVFGTLTIMSIKYTSVGTMVTLIVGFDGFMWIIDCFNICINQFKVPVYID